MADNPYKVVVEALAAQSIAIGRLAKEIKVEFAQYQAAQAANDNAKANRIAAAINDRTEKLSAAADQLAASYPGAVVGGGPAEPPVDPGFGNPGGSGPVDPGFGNPGSERPDQGLPPVPGRPDQGLPETPVDPGFGNPGGGQQPPNTKPEPPGSTKPTPPVEPKR